MSIIIDGVSIVAGSSVRYLGVLPDSRLNFTDHARASAVKVSGAVQKIRRILLNISAVTPTIKKAAGNMVSCWLFLCEAGMGGLNKQHGQKTNTQSAEKNCLQGGFTVLHCITRCIAGSSKLALTDLLGAERKGV